VIPWSGVVSGWLGESQFEGATGPIPLSFGCPLVLQSSIDLQFRHRALHSSPMRLPFCTRSIFGHRPLIFVSALVPWKPALSFCLLTQFFVFSDGPVLVHRSQPGARLCPSSRSGFSGRRVRSAILSPELCASSPGHLVFSTSEQSLPDFSLLFSPGVPVLLSSTYQFGVVPFNLVCTRSESPSYRVIRFLGSRW
jgi:hypothetical protein